MNDLPLELIKHIAMLDHNTWYLMVQIFKWLSETISIDEVKQKFLQKRQNVIHNEDDITFSEAYCLPNGVLHNYDELSIEESGMQYWYYNGKHHRYNDTSRK